MFPASIEELDTIKKECLRMSNRRALLSAAASIIPIPLTDIATDVVLLKQIIPRISERFGLSKEQIDEYNPQLAVFIYDIAKRLGAKMIGKYVTKELIAQIVKKMGVRFTTKQAAKYIPVLGQAISAGISFTAMRMIIRSHVNECYKVAKTVIEANKI
jgi:uncharacterized protein (DUF697 family)